MRMYLLEWAGPLLVTGLTVTAIVFAYHSPNEASEWKRRGNETRILVDTLHQREGLPHYTWNEGVFGYPASATVSPLLNQLALHEMTYDMLETGDLSKESLKGYDILLFNVPLTPDVAKQKKMKRTIKPLSEYEISAIDEYVLNGGGVLIVGEHNNAYDNMEILKPLLEEWDVYLEDAYAAEPTKGHYAINHSGYRILVRHFEEHFITQGVSVISEAGGAPFHPDSIGGVAFMSSNGFIDYGNYITNKPTHYSNHKVDEGEYQGPNIPVVIAGERGKGRFVVLGDHNMIGAHWIGLGDNREFGLNIFQWLAHREQERPFRSYNPKGLRFGLEQEQVGWTAATKDKNGYYYFYLGLTQNSEIVPMAMSGFGKEVDVLAFLDPDTVYGKSDLEKVDQVFEKGRTVFLLVDMEKPKGGSIQLLQRYLPSLSIKGEGGTISAQQMRAGKNPYITRVEGQYLPLESSEIDVEGINVAALSHPKGNLKKMAGNEYVPKIYDKGIPYMLDLHVDGGTSLVSAVLPDGRSTAVLNRFKVGNGQLIVMVQGKIWSGYTMPYGIVPPEKRSRPAYDFEMRFLDWLVKTVE